ncbi:MAG: ABC transporter ATP-binding protein [Acidimicrobiia bacterium]
MAIITKGLTKWYGKAPGILDLSLEVHRGEVFGFLGPNGAGKTTTIRLLMGSLVPTSGSALVLGTEPGPEAIGPRRNTGYVPGDTALYGHLTGTETIEYFSRIRGGVDGAYVAALLERLDLDPTRRVEDYSSGNRQKVALLLAWMHRPELLILDEPTTGLDPLLQHEFYRMVDEARAAGVTVFLSSHILPEVERIADRVAVIRRGRLVVVDEVANLKARALRRLEFHFAAPVSAAEFERLPAVRSVTAHDTSMIIEFEGEVDKVIKAAAPHFVIDVISREPDLEDVFLHLYQDITE